MCAIAFELSSLVIVGFFRMAGVLDAGYGMSLRNEGSRAFGQTFSARWAIGARCSFEVNEKRYGLSHASRAGCTFATLPELSPARDWTGLGFLHEFPGAPLPLGVATRQGEVVGVGAPFPAVVDGSD
jgi:hypothetical protein